MYISLYFNPCCDGKDWKPDATSQSYQFLWHSPTSFARGKSVRQSKTSTDVAMDDIYLWKDARAMVSLVEHQNRDLIEYYELEQSVRSN